MITNLPSPRAAEERPRVFHEIEQEHQLFEAVIDQSPVGIAVVDGKEFRVLWANPTILQFLEEPFRSKGIIGSPIGQFVPGAQESGLIEIFRQVAETGQPHAAQEYAHVGFARGVTYWNWSLHSLRSEGKEMPDLMLVLTDITEQVLARQRAEEYARQLAEARQTAEEQRASYQALFDFAPDAYLVTTPDGIISEANLAATSMLGLSADALVGRRLSDYVIGRERQLFCDWIAEPDAMERERDWRVNLQPDTGPSFVAAIRVAAVRDHHSPQQVTALRWLLRDVSEHMRAVQQLQHSRDELESRVQERTAALELSYAGERQAREIADTLRSASLAITRSLNLGTILEILLDYLERLVPYDSAHIVVIRQEAKPGIIALRGYEGSDMGSPTGPLAQHAQSSPIVERLLKTRESIRIKDTRQEEEWKPPAELAHVRSWLSVPLFVGADTIGFFALDKREPRFFTEEHRRLAEALGAQASVSIQNAWLFEQGSAAREHLQFLSRRLIEVQENERRYIARELHDEAGQALTTLIVGLRLLERQVDRPSELLASVGELRGLVDGVLENLHRLAMDLMPASLDHLGLKGALYQYVEAFQEQHDLNVTFKIEGFEGMRLAPDLETTLYRFVQEALTNIARHARASHIDIHLVRSPDLVKTTVQDDGVGFNPEVVIASGRLGLLGLEERAELLGGKLFIDSRPGKGTTLVMEVPYGDSNSDCR